MERLPHPPSDKRGEILSRVDGFRRLSPQECVHLQPMEHVAGEPYALAPADPRDQQDHMLPAPPTLPLTVARSGEQIHVAAGEFLLAANEGWQHIRQAPVDIYGGVKDPEAPLAVGTV